jgi:simple sugar transport system ATP-binding protein
LQDGLGAIVVENPTRGLDIRAAGQVLGALRSAAAAGAAVVMYSSDIDELLATCDRILVCFGGRVREVPAEPDAIGHAMVGART